MNDRYPQTGRRRPDGWYLSPGRCWKLGQRWEPGQCQTPDWCSRFGRHQRADRCCWGVRYSTGRCWGDQSSGGRCRLAEPCRLIAPGRRTVRYAVHSRRCPRPHHGLSGSGPRSRPFPRSGRRNCRRNAATCRRAPRKKCDLRTRCHETWWWGRRRGRGVRLRSRRTGRRGGDDPRSSCLVLCWNGGRRRHDAARRRSRRCSLAGFPLFLAPAVRSVAGPFSTAAHGLLWFRRSASLACLLILRPPWSSVCCVRG